MGDRISRGEMMRQLDELSIEVYQRMANGPLTEDEQHMLSAALERLRLIVAEELHDVEDAHATAILPRPRYVAHTQLCAPSLRLPSAGLIQGFSPQGEP